MKNFLLFFILTILTLQLHAEKTFDLSKRTLFWRAVKFQKAAFVDGKGLELSGSGRIHSSRFQLNAAENGLIQVNFTGKVRFAKLYFRQSKDKLSEAASVRGTIVDSTIIFDTARNKLWQGEIAELRIDLIPADNSPVIIRSIECKARRTTSDISGAWQKKKFIAPGQTLTDTIAYDLRLPVTLTGYADNTLVLNVTYRDIYGKRLRQRNTTFRGKCVMPLFELPEKTAAIELNVSNTGTKAAQFSLTATQELEAKTLPIPQGKYQAKLLSPLPGNTDENFVWHPEIEVTPFRAGSTCMLYFTADDGRRIIVANGKLTAKSNKLNTLFFRYLTPGRYRLHLEVNDRPVELAGNTEFHHRNHAPVGLPKVEIDFSGARPEYVIDGQERVGTAEHLSGDPKLAPKAFNQIINAVDAGVKGVRLRLIFRFTTGNKVDFSELVEAMESVLLRKPEVNLMIHVSVTDPGFKFRLLNPAEGIKDDKGNFHILNYRKTPEATSSMASKKWQQNSRELLIQLVKHLDSIPAGRRLIGILPCSGITWEWLHWGSAQGVMVDYSEHYRKFYHRFLQKRYHNIAALNAAWHSSFKSFDEISIPSPARRKISTGLELRSPAQFQPEIDHVDSLADLISGVIIDLCSTIKTASGNRLLTGTYYGYTNYLTGALRSHNAGHNAVMRIMRSPSLDILMAPSRYAGRTIGGGGGFMFPEGSARLHRKLVISECDVRPVGASNASGRIDTVSGSRAIFEREYGAQLAAGAAMRWFDFSHGWVMQEPRLLEVVKRTTSFDEKIRRGNFPVLDIADTVAVFTSERSAAFLTPDSRLHDMILENIYRQLINSGTAFKMYDLQDLAAVAPKCRVLIFLNAFILTEAEKSLLLKLATDANKTLIFVYGTGLNDGEQLNTGFMSKLFNCGFKVYDNRKIYNYRYKKQDFTTRFACAPVYIPDAGKVLAKSTDGKAALVELPNRGAKIIFAALPLLPAQLVTEYAAAAGLPHVATGDQNSPVWFGANTLVIHSGKGCEATIRLPRGFCGISDYATGKFYPAVKGVLSCRIPAGGSWWGELVPAGKKR